MHTNENPSYPDVVTALSTQITDSAWQEADIMQQLLLARVWHQLTPEAHNLIDPNEIAGAIQDKLLESLLAQAPKKELQATIS